MLILLIILLLLCGGGTGYWGWRSDGYARGGGILGTILVIVVVIYLLEHFR